MTLTAKSNRIILQIEHPGYLRHKVYQVPARYPSTLIRISTPCSYVNPCELAESLEEELAKSFEAIPLNPRWTKRTSCHNPESCNPNYNQLLVVLSCAICRDKARIVHPAWPNQNPGNSKYGILPIIKSEDKTLFKDLFHSSIHHINAAVWQKSIKDVTPAILAAAGLTPERLRIFISYRQQEASGLAIQLFDALSQNHFDVFLDHFKIPPAVDFQARLNEELGHKSMVLILSSQGIYDSRWTAHEITLARRHKLGIFALQLPGGPRIRNLGPTQQIRLDQTKFHRGRFSKSARLRKDTLDSLIAEIRREHDRAYIRRQKTLTNNVTAALLRAGIPPRDLSFTSQGNLMVASRANIPEYHIRLSPRPPETNDFHAIYPVITPKPSVKAVIVSQTALLTNKSLEQTKWLSKVSKVRIGGHGQVKRTARGIQRGSL